VENSVEIFKSMEKKALGPLLISKAAEADGAEIEWLTKYIFIARAQGVEVVFWDCRAIDTSVSAKITGRKDLTRRFLEKKGVPIAAGGVVNSLDGALRLWKKIGSPIVIKPKTGTKGKGVSVGLNSEGEIVAAYKRASVKGNGVLVEETLGGEEYRVLVVGGKAVAALGKDAANVTGDGKLSIKELVDKKNTLRKTNPHLSTRLIKIDGHVEGNLTRQGLNPESVLAEGEKIYLRKEANFSAGGDTVDVTGLLPLSVMEVAEKAVKAIPGLEVAGVDIMYDKESKAQNVFVIEINTNPGIGGHHYPAKGAKRNVAGMIWEHVRNTYTS